MSLSFLKFDMITSHFRAFIRFRLAPNTTAFFQRTSSKAMELINGAMDVYIQAIGGIIKCTVRICYSFHAMRFVMV